MVVTVATRITTRSLRRSILSPARTTVTEPTECPRVSRGLELIDAGLDWQPTVGCHWPAAESNLIDVIILIDTGKRCRMTGCSRWSVSSASQTRAWSKTITEPEFDLFLIISVAEAPDMGSGRLLEMRPSPQNVADDPCPFARQRNAKNMSSLIPKSLAHTPIHNIIPHPKY